MKDQELFEAYRCRPTKGTLVDLLRAYENTVYNLCHQVLRHRQNAEDASQQVFLEILRYLKHIKDSDHLRKSIHRISFHVALNAKKQARTRQGYERKKAEMMAPAADPFDRQEVEDVLHEHMVRLEDEHRSLLVDYFFDGQPLEGIASNCGCSPNAIWKKLEKAKDALRGSLRRAGLGGMAALMGSTLEAASYSCAPRDLVSSIITPEALATLEGGGGASILIRGGMIVKQKLVVSIALGVLATAWGGYAIVRHYDARAVPTDRIARAAIPGQASEIPAGSPRTQAGREESFAPGGSSFRSIKAWVEACKKAALIPGDDERCDALRAVGLSLSNEDFQIAFRRFPWKAKWTAQESVAFPRRAQGFLNAIFSRWVEVDPKGATFFAFSLVEAEDDEPFKNSLLEWFISGWAEKEPDAAREFAKTLPNEDERSTVLSHLQILADPAHFAQIVKTLPELEQLDAIYYLPSIWAKIDSGAALDWNRNLTEETERTIYLLSVAEELGHQNLEGALKEYPDKKYFVSEDQRGDFICKVFKTAAQDDPKATWERALKFVDLEASLKPIVFSTIAKEWAYFDPPAAVEALGTLLPGKSLYVQDELARLLSAWARGPDTEAALAWAGRLTDTGQRSKMITVALEGWVISDHSNPAGALSVVATLPAEVRKDATRGILVAWAQVDAPKAAQFGQAIGILPAGDIAGSWANQDLPGAIQWAKGITDIGKRNEALAGVALQLSDRYRSDAREMSELLPQSISLLQEVSDPALQLWMGGQMFCIGAALPQAALACVETLPERAPRTISYGQRDFRVPTRQEIAKYILIRMNDPAEALKWIGQSQLTDVEKSNLSTSVRELLPK